MVLLSLAGGIAIVFLAHWLADRSVARELAKLGIVMPPRTRRERWRDAFTTVSVPHTFTDPARRGLRGWARWMTGQPGFTWQALAVASGVAGGVMREGAGKTFAILGIVVAIVFVVSYLYWRKGGWHHLYWWEDPPEPAPTA